MSVAGTAGHEGVIAEAQARFNKYTAGDKSAIHPNLRLAVFRIAIAEGGEDALDAVFKEYINTTTVDGREICLASFGRARNPECIRRVLDLIISSKVKVQDKHTPAIALSNNADARYELWKFIQENWKTLFGQMSGNMVVLDRFLKNSLNKFPSAARWRRLRLSLRTRITLDTTRVLRSFVIPFRAMLGLLRERRPRCWSG